jgi:hypothetical protein
MMTLAAKLTTQCLANSAADTVLRCRDIAADDSHFIQALAYRRNAFIQAHEQIFAETAARRTVHWWEHLKMQGQMLQVSHCQLILISLVEWYINIIIYRNPHVCMH